MDAFPKDPKEWVDTDGDGVGDNEDHFPQDPKCQKIGQEGCKDSGVEKIDSSDRTIDKKLRPLPISGYDEYHHHRVQHEDGKSHTSDWLGEDPSKYGEGVETAMICQKHPHLRWC